jgi:hypothetical protein
MYCTCIIVVYIYKNVKTSEHNKINASESLKNTIIVFLRYHHNWKNSFMRTNKIDIIWNYNGINRTIVTEK